MVLVLRHRSKAKGKFATSPSHASNNAFSSHCSFYHIISFRGCHSSYYRFHLNQSEKRSQRGKGLSKMNKSFGKKLKVHVDLIKWKDMEVHDFNLGLDNLDEEKDLNGEECDRISFFKFKEGKGWMPPETKAKYNEMIELKEKSSSDDKPLTTDEICDQVLGTQSGYIKGLGYGPKPKKKQNHLFKLRDLHMLLKNLKIDLEN
ncbi:hypothetical protein Patl1_05333 [Pistacia atlantica]|uniref:Uncharacterized protein n=1 Tax=Pistacia atlantica TaxID=434234 RepID=A0ACC1BWD3_9ROSI|nr:hypothetical protein Patl1_05333 [Pistacia atlantica]